MSEPAGVEPTEPESIELPAQGNAAFGALMDALAPEEDKPTAGEAGATSAPAAAGDGQAAGAGEGDGAAAPVAGEPAVGADGKPVVPTAGEPGASAGADRSDVSGPGRDLPESWTASASEYAPKLGELSTAFEESTTRAYHEASLEEARKEYSNYFDAISKPARVLVGAKVPKIDGTEGEETLRDEADVLSWQSAVKTILADEIRGRATKALDENRDFLTTIHSSIDLFKNNLDLIPGTKEFDRELADRFVKLAEPYELRSAEGKLQGYSIPPQGMINQLRADITAGRTAAPAAAAPAATPPAPGDQPSAGITSQAGNSGDAGEDFSSLFATLGLPNLRI